MNEGWKIGLDWIGLDWRVERLGWFVLEGWKIGRLEDWKINGKLERLWNSKGLESWMVWKAGVTLKVWKVWEDWRVWKAWKDFGSLKGLKRLESLESLGRLWESEGLGKPGKLGSLESLERLGRLWKSERI